MEGGRENGRNYENACIDHVRNILHMKRHNQNNFNATKYYTCIRIKIESGLRTTVVVTQDPGIGSYRSSWIIGTERAISHLI